MKAVIFDMDGVISDTQTIAANVESKIFKRYGLDIAPEYCTAVYAGTAHRYMYEKEFTKAGITADITQVIKETRDILLNARELVREIPGSIALIKECKSAGFKLAVASGSIHEFIDMVLTTLGIKELFDVIISTTDVKHGKPAPDIFLLAAQKLNVTPRHCIVIEDGINGMQAAKAAGMKCIGLVEDSTKTYPATIIVKELGEVTIKRIGEIMNEKEDTCRKDYNALSLALHKKNKGKIKIVSKVRVKTRDDLSIAYTPGVAEPCRAIAANKDEVYTYTAKGNIVAVITDGTAVLGLGDIGPEASLPVMEGKAILFKTFAGIDAFPIAINSKDVEEIVRTVKLISPWLGGVNLEDISAPRCFEIEDRLKKELDIPVFHDDQHGTAIVVLAGLTNALKLAGKQLSGIKIVISGAGAAGDAIARLLLHSGAKNIILVDRNGAIYTGRTAHMNPEKETIARMTNPNLEKGTLQDVMKGADVFIGVSAPGLMTAEMVSSMNQKSIIFAMANPTPEIMPEIAKGAGAFIIATGRSDYPNQVNNVLVFPGIFKGALKVRAREINIEMKIAAAHALAGLVKEPAIDRIIPSPFDKGVAQTIARAVIKAAKRTKVNRI